jgi:hypothetical protein
MIFVLKYHIKIIKSLSYILSNAEGLAMDLSNCTIVEDDIFLWN